MHPSPHRARTGVRGCPSKTGGDRDHMGTKALNTITCSRVPKNPTKRHKLKDKIAVKNFRMAMTEYRTPSTGSPSEHGAQGLIPEADPIRALGL